MRWKAAAWLLVGLLIGAGVWFSLSGNRVIQGSDRSQVYTATPRVPPTVGLPAPNFTLVDMDGQPFQLSAFQGKPVVVNFWATWCPPCRAEMPLLEKYAQKYSKDLVLVGVNQLESHETVHSFIAEFGIHFPIVLDENGVAARLYYTQSYPVTFFISAEGILKAQHRGELNENLLVSYLGTLGIKP